MVNQIKFTKEQLQIAITDYIKTETNISDVFSMVVNGLMYSERTAFLSTDEASNNKGNGYRRKLNAGLGSGLELQIPRDRLGLFKPVILGVLEQQDERIKELSFSLYGKGLTTLQISEVLYDIYGDNYSKSSVSRISNAFSEQVKAWQNRPLEAYYPCIFIDATHTKVRRDVVSSEAFYVVLGLKADFTREVLAIVNFPTESATGWEDVLKQLELRGLKKVHLFISDELKGLSQAICKVFSTSKQQKCILHFQKGLSKHIRVKDRFQFCQEVKEVFKPDEKSYTMAAAEENLRDLLGKWIKKYPVLQNVLNRNDLSHFFTYLEYDYRIRRMIYTTNWIERLNKSFKRTLKIRNALPTIDSVLLLMGYVAMEMEERTYKFSITNFNFEPQFEYNGQS